MGVLDQITKLKSEGINDEEIVNSLREQGISPREINDALSQSQIKGAVDAPTEQTREMEPSIMRPGKAEPLPTEGSAPSDEELSPPPGTPQIPAAARKRFGSMTKEVGEEEYVPEPQENSYAPQPQYSQFQNQPQEYYPQESYGYTPAGGTVTDTDTMIEIAEQVFSEKIKILQKQSEELNEFKTLAQSKINNISDRLKRIEANIDRLQSSILEKVGSYGRGLEGVKKEMTMMQNSFGKVVGKLSHTTHRTTHKKAPARKKTTKRKTTSKARKKK